MIKVYENEQRNAKLKKLYEENTNKYLKILPKNEALKSIERINEFGIIDVNTFDSEKGVLFIAKETNGWDYSNGQTFRKWVEEMAKSGKITGEIASKHPQFWYNLGRWSKFIANPQIDKNTLAKEKDITSLKTVAITNINKVEGGSTSGKVFWEIVGNDVVKNILIDEIGEIKPKLIVLCGIKKEDIADIISKVDGNIMIVEMPHPSARNIPKKDMILQLEREMKKVGWM